MTKPKSKAAAMRWPDIITRDGFTANRRQLYEAWDHWCAQEHRTALTLSVALTRICLAPEDTRLYPYSRVADAMLQYARKACAIEFRKGSWHLVGGSPAE